MDRRDNAHACQQGGHANRFDAETGNPFKNASDCASHGAMGGAASSLQILTGTYACSGGLGGTCWGTLSGSGLQPDLPWQVYDDNGGEVLQTGSPNADGSVSQQLNLPCDDNLFPLFATATTSLGTGITSADVDSPCG